MTGSLSLVSSALVPHDVFQSWHISYHQLPLAVTGNFYQPGWCSIVFEATVKAHGLEKFTVLHAVRSLVSFLLFFVWKEIPKDQNSIIAQRALDVSVPSGGSVAERSQEQGTKLLTFTLTAVLRVVLKRPAQQELLSHFSLPYPEAESNIFLLLCIHDTLQHVLVSS